MEYSVLSPPSSRVGEQPPVKRRRLASTLSQSSNMLIRAIPEGFRVLHKRRPQPWKIILHKSTFWVLSFQSEKIETIEQWMAPPIQVHPTSSFVMAKTQHVCPCEISQVVGFLCSHNHSFHVASCVQKYENFQQLTNFLPRDMVKIIHSYWSDSFLEWFIAMYFGKPN